jgi:hypothetical protein
VTKAAIKLQTQIIEWKAQRNGLDATPKVARKAIVANLDSLNRIDKNNNLLVLKLVTNTCAHPFHFVHAVPKSVKDEQRSMPYPSALSAYSRLVNVLRSVCEASHCPRLSRRPRWRAPNNRPNKSEPIRIHQEFKALTPQLFVIGLTPTNPSHQREQATVPCNPNHQWTRAK